MDRNKGRRTGGRTRTLVSLALFTAIVVVLQALGSFIRFGPFSISLVMAPIVIGAVLYGPLAGAWLGGVFGLVVLLSGDAGAFLAINPLGAILTVMVKGIACGVAAGWGYRLLCRANEYVAVVVAAIACPVVNTGLFLLGCLAFFMDYVASVAETMGFTGSAGAFLIVGFVGMNFVVELLVNAVLSPVIVRLTRIGRKV